MFSHSGHLPHIICPAPAGSFVMCRCHLDQVTGRSHETQTGGKLAETRETLGVKTIPLSKVSSDDAVLSRSSVSGTQSLRGVTREPRKNLETTDERALCLMTCCSTFIAFLHFTHVSAHVVCAPRECVRAQTRCNAGPRVRERCPPRRQDRPAGLRTGDACVLCPCLSPS